MCKRTTLSLQLTSWFLFLSKCPPLLPHLHKWKLLLTVMSFALHCPAGRPPWKPMEYHVTVTHTGRTSAEAPSHSADCLYKLPHTPPLPFLLSSSFVRLMSSSHRRWRSALSQNVIGDHPEASTVPSRCRYSQAYFAVLREIFHPTVRGPCLRPLPCRNAAGHRPIQDLARAVEKEAIPRTKYEHPYGKCRGGWCRVGNLPQGQPHRS